MNWKVIKTERHYQKALSCTFEIFHTSKNSPEGEELALLLVLLKDYEDKHIVLPDLDIMEVVKLKMQEKGIKPKDLEKLIGSKSHVSSILSGRRELTLKMARNLKQYFNLPAEVFV